MKQISLLLPILLFAAVSLSAQEGGDCPPVQNLTGSGFNETVTLQWDAPEKYVHNEPIGYSKDHVLGYTTGCICLAAIRWSPEQLVELGVKNDSFLSAIMFANPWGFHETDCYVYIWQGGTSMQDPGELISYQEITTSVEEKEWNTVPLHEPVPIDTSKELRIGYRIDQNKSYDFFFPGLDSGPLKIPQYSDLMMFTYDQTWFSITEDIHLNSNICLYGIITEKIPVSQYNIYKDVQLIGSTQRRSFQDEEALKEALYCVEAKYEDGCASNQECIEITPCTPPYNLQVTFGEFSEEGAHLTWEWLSDEGIFNIYRDETLISKECTAMEYIDYGIDPETEYIWSVTTICEEGETSPASVSGLTPKKGVGIARDEENGIVVYPNPTKGTLRIKNEKLKIKNIKLFDVFGRLVLESAEMVYDIGHLSAGVYIMRAETNEGIITKKVVKQ